ncbi:MAG: UDP-2,3-diacylglucosamine diphosphatase [Kiritimatiellae bacterium]|nr:UDP-2,3-diacylglucosamine diphosphatase [Kiritimatiellia bacterium]MDW8457963.1 UDP-2,3-diacylglucosamine diphosphatase [Verrucomicrobiota bacterium]
MKAKAPVTTFRTIWLSDIHLGTRGCKAHALLDFLRHHDAEYIYLVGDIFDGWALRKSWYWSQEFNDVVQKLLRKARKGAKVVYLPGNHDEFMHHFVDLEFGHIAIKKEVIHTTADGRRLLVLHGDEFDGVVKYNKWLALLGSRAYDAALILNHWFNVIRRAMGLPYWSLAAFLKYKVKNACKFVSDFENALAEHARKQRCDGIVCGHIHRAEIRRIHEIEYCNDGDWVESCTSLVEHHDGRLELITWADVRGTANAEEAEATRESIPAPTPLPFSSTAIHALRLPVDSNAARAISPLLPHSM